MMIDHKALLRKYISHLKKSEGIDFIGEIDESGCMYEYLSDVVFTPEEVVELRRISKSLSYATPPRDTDEI